jgi:hypothetical protein
VHIALVHYRCQSNIQSIDLSIKRSLTYFIDKVHDSPVDQWYNPVIFRGGRFNVRNATTIEVFHVVVILKYWTKSAVGPEDLSKTGHVSGYRILQGPNNS